MRLKFKRAQIRLWLAPRPRGITTKKEEEEDKLREEEKEVMGGEEEMSVEERKLIRRGTLKKGEGEKEINWSTFENVDSIIRSVREKGREFCVHENHLFNEKLEWLCPVQVSSSKK